MPQALEIGRVLGTAFRCLSAGGGVVLALSVVLSLPEYLALEAIVRHVDERPPSEAADLAPLLATAGAYFALACVLRPILLGAVCHGVLRHLGGGAVRLLDCLASGLARAPTIFVADLVTTVLMVPAFACFGVPGCVLAAVLAVFVPVVVRERVGPIAALHRSAELTRGNRWRVFYVRFFLFVVALFVQQGFAILRLLSYHVGAFETGVWWLAYVAAAVFSTLQWSALAVIYAELLALEAARLGDVPVGEPNL